MPRSVGVVDIGHRPRLAALTLARRLLLNHPVPGSLALIHNPRLTGDRQAPQPKQHALTCRAPLRNRRWPHWEIIARGIQEQRQ